MQTGSSLLSGLTSVIAVVALLGLAVGIGVSNTDLLNFNRSVAEAETLKYTAELQAQQNPIILQYFERIQDAETKAAIEKINIETEAFREELKSKLIAKQRANAVWLMVGPLAVLTIAIALGILLVQYGRSRLLLAEAKAAQIKMIQVARANERAWRTDELTQQAKIPAEGGNGHHTVEAAVTR